MIRTALVIVMAGAAAMAQTNPTPPVGSGAQSSAVARKGSTPVAVASYKDLRFPELRPIAFPHIEHVTLSNGMQVYLLEDHELPLVNATVMVRTGTAFDPPEKAGLAALTGEVILEGGTAARPGEDLIRRFQNLGVDVEGTVADTWLAISFSALKENALDALGILDDGLTGPELPQERIDLVKTRMRNGIAHRNDDPAAVLQREFLRALFGKDSPYGTRVEYATIDRINRADLVNFHRRYFFPRNVILSLAGDFDSGSMKTSIETLFDDWKAEQSPVPDFPKPPAEPAPGTYLAVKKDAGMTYFAVGELSGDYLDKDYAALQIAADILAGGPRGRIYQRLHTDIEPLSAAWSPGAGRAGVFRISGSINTFVTVKVLRTIREEMEKLRSTEVTDSELKGAKDAVLNSFVFAFDNQLSIMPRLTQYAYLNLPQDYIQQHQAALAAVTRADVLRVARERMDPAKMTTLVVGNPTGFDSPLDSLGGPPPIPIDLTIPAPKVEAETGDAASERRGRELLGRAQQAFGGAGKLAQVNDYLQEMTYRFLSANNSVEMTSTERWMAPGNLRQDNVLPNGEFSAFCDGKSGWAANGAATSVLSGVPLQQMQSDLFRILFPLLLSDRTQGRTLIALDENTVQIGDSAGQLVKVVLDPATGLIRNVLYDAVTANGPVPVIDTYSDYRDVGGVKIPFQVAITVSGQKYQDVIVKSFQVNAGLKIQDLEKRP